jgi:ATP-binding cassette subfamily C protein
MTISSDPASTGIHAFLSLVRKFADFAGRRGVLALLLMMCGAAFESIGLLLLVPLLSLVIGGSTSLSPFRAMMGRFFALLGAHSSLGQLCWLMAGLAVLMLVRGIMITLRDRAVQSLQIEFIDSLRGDLASALAGAGWDQVLRLRHARVLNAMSSDVQRIAMASNYVLQSCVAIVILLAQAALSFALSPTLALFSFALLAVGAAAMVPVLRRAREMGRFIGGANLVLMDSKWQSARICRTASYRNSGRRSAI